VLHTSKNNNKQTTEDVPRSAKGREEKDSLWKEARLRGRERLSKGTYCAVEREGEALKGAERRERESKCVCL